MRLPVWEKIPLLVFPDEKKEKKIRTTLRRSPDLQVNASVMSFLLFLFFPASGGNGESSAMLGRQVMDGGTAFRRDPAPYLSMRTGPVRRRVIRIPTHLDWRGRLGNSSQGWLGLQLVERGCFGPVDTQCYTLLCVLCSVFRVLLPVESNTTASHDSTSESSRAESSRRGGIEFF